MGRKLVVDRGRAVVEFDPRQTKAKVAGYKEAIVRARRIANWEAAPGEKWETIAQAVDGIIAEQKTFVAWWQATVTPGRDKRENLRGATVNARTHEPITAADAEEATGITQPQVSRWKAKTQNQEAEDKYRAWLLGQALRAALDLTSRDVMRGSEEDEWYTPSVYIEAARAVMGGIDLDPASSPAANRTVKAPLIYTKSDNALEQSWKGRVWLNPPYQGETGQGAATIWVREIPQKVREIPHPPTLSPIARKPPASFYPSPTRTTGARPGSSRT